MYAWLCVDVTKKNLKIQHSEPPAAEHCDEFVTPGTVLGAALPPPATSS